MAELALKVRHYNFDFPEGQPWREENMHDLVATRTFNPEEMALVLVDCWDRHYLRSYLERTDQIIREKIVPVVEACHDLDMTVIHAPSPAQAKRYPQWLQYAGDEELNPPAAPTLPDWPPQNFRYRSGDYQQFAKPPGAVVQAWRIVEADQRKIVSELEPREDEFVVATGRQLHRLLRHRKILHLVYVGFATNMCVVGRDYGMRAMHGRGYNVMLLRDCTTGIEAYDTVGDMALTRAAILEVEMLMGFTSTSESLIEGARDYVKTKAAETGQSVTSTAGRSQLAPAPAAQNSFDRFATRLGAK
ncbi:MAG: isochorismatase family protein [Armatimonadota bacterium]